MKQCFKRLDTVTSSPYISALPHADESPVRPTENEIVQETGKPGSVCYLLFDIVGWKGDVDGGLVYDHYLYFQATSPVLRLV